MRPKKGKRQRQTGNNFPRFSNHVLPYEFWIELLLTGKFKKFKGRKIIRIGGLFFPWARVYWNIMNPGDPALPHEDIHHKDERKENDSYENLEKKDKNEHSRIHRQQQRVGIRDYRDYLALLRKERANTFSHIPRTFNGWFNQRALCAS